MFLRDRLMELLGGGDEQQQAPRQMKRPARQPMQQMAMPAKKPMAQMAQPMEQGAARRVTRPMYGPSVQGNGQIAPVQNFYPRAEDSYTEADYTQGTPSYRNPQVTPNGYFNQGMPMNSISQDPYGKYRNIRF